MTRTFIFIFLYQFENSYKIITTALHDQLESSFLFYNLLHWPLTIQNHTIPD